MIEDLGVMTNFETSREFGFRYIEDEHEKETLALHVKNLNTFLRWYDQINMKDIPEVTRLIRASQTHIEYENYDMLFNKLTEEIETEKETK